MTYESLMIANQTITKIEVKGKEYAEVNQRIRVFRMLYPNGSIETRYGGLPRRESLSGRKKKRYMDLTGCQLQSMWRTRSAHVSLNRQSR